MTQNSFSTHVGDGSTQLFGIVVPFLSLDHLVVTVDTVPLTGPGPDPGFEWEPFPVSNQFPVVIRIHTPPANLAVVRIQRVTPHDSLFVTFVDDIPVTALDLNNDFLQVIYYAEEVEDLATA